MPKCIVAGCNNSADHNLSVRPRRPDTTAIWAPNAEAYICDAHADGGMTVEVILTPNPSGAITTVVSSPGSSPVSRTTPITQEP
jgi:hypothetical protein